MGRIIDLTVPENITDLLKRNQTTTDFRILTDGMVSDIDNPNIVRMVGSSTERDLEGDTMSIHALQSMTKAAPNMTVWLNHDYTLPGSMFGSIIETPKIVHSNGIADLHLAVDVELENPAAAQVKRYIDKGRRLGCSIGCMVTQFEVAEDTDDMSDESIMKIMQMGGAPIIIHGVYVVEYSVVGIPANQRSWVENAIRGVFTRTLHPSLAPAMKTLWPRQFQEVLETRELSTDTKEYFKSLPARGSSGKRLDYLPEKKMFLLSGMGTEKYMSREEVQDHMSNLEVVMASKGLLEIKSETSLAPYKEQVKEPELVQTACGSTSLALDMESSWDKGAAHGRILAWAGGKDNFSTSKMKEVHFRYDGDGSNITDYHLPFADIKNGHPVAIWHAIHAVASSLGGGRSGLTHEGDEAAIRSKVAHYYKKAGKTPPWQAKEDNKSMGDENITTHTHENGETHTHDTAIKHIGFALNKDGAPGVLIDANGNHEPVSGTHTHFHRMPQDANEKTASALGVIHNPLEVTEPNLSGKVPMDTGDGGEKFENPLEVTDPVTNIKLPVNGQIHIHEHTHDGDNNHEHVHEQDTVQAFKPPVGVQNADRDGDNDIDPTSGPDIDAGGGRQLGADPDVAKAQLELYNNLGKMLGFEAKEYPTTPSYDTPPAPVAGSGIPPHVQKRMAAIHARTYAMTGGKVCSGFGSDGSHLSHPGEAPNGTHPIPVHITHAPHLQNIHDHAHALSGNDGDADDMQKDLELHLTKAAGDAIYGPGSGGGVASPANMPDHVHKRLQAIHTACYSMTGGKVCSGIGSDGQHLTYPTQAPDGTHPVPHHPAHAGHVQAIHDHVHALTGGMMCRSFGANETNYNTARQQLMDAEGQTGPNAPANPLKSFEGMPEHLDRIVKALEGVNTKGMASEVEVMKKELHIARKGIAAVYEEAAKAAATVAALKNMPLGNPIKQHRAVEPDPTLTSHEELKTLSTGPETTTLPGLLALTQLETVKLLNGMSISYRKWANGLGGTVGKGLRPALTSNQKALMPFEEIDAYNAGFAASVPMVDDPGQDIELF